MYYEDIVSNFRFWTIDSGMKCQMYNNFLLGNGSGFVLKQVEITKIKRITLWFTISICISWHEDECWSNDSDQAPTNKDQHISSRWHLISSRLHFLFLSCTSDEVMGKRKRKRESERLNNEFCFNGGGARERETGGGWVMGIK